MRCGRNFCEKTTNLGIWTAFEGRYGWRTTLVDGSLESPWAAFLFALIKFFRYLLRFRSYEAKCAQLSCFRKFHLDTAVPINHSWQQKTRDTGLPDGEDRIPLHSLVLFWHNTGVWRTDGRTDRRICCSIYSACKASFAQKVRKTQSSGYQKRSTVWNEGFLEQIEQSGMKMMRVGVTKR